MDWKDFGAYMRQASAEKRAKNRKRGEEIIIDYGLEHEVKNYGAHIIVRHNGKTADYWPGTGKYNIRGTSSYKRGVFNLLKDLEVRRMRPQPVSDYELEHGVDNSDYIPNDALPYSDSSMAAAHAIMYESDLDNFEFAPRLQLDIELSKRHLRAVKATKVSPKTKVQALARLVTLWYHTVTPKGEASNG